MGIRIRGQTKTRNILYLYGGASPGYAGRGIVRRNDVNELVSVELTV